MDVIFTDTHGHEIPSSVYVEMLGEHAAIRYCIDHQLVHNWLKMFGLEGDGLLLEKLETDPAQTGKGYGKALLLESLRWLGIGGCVWLQAVPYRHEWTRAVSDRWKGLTEGWETSFNQSIPKAKLIKLYESVGFIMVDEDNSIMKLERKL